MKKILIILSNLTWGIVQTLIGLLCCITLFWRPKRFYRGTVVTNLGGWSGFSLGNFLFVNGDWTLTKHEYGHSIQSAMLGIFYLLIILPCSMWWYWFGYDRAYKKAKESGLPRVRYEEYWCEAWAEKLGETDIK